MRCYTPTPTPHTHTPHRQHTWPEKKWTNAKRPPTSTAHGVGPTWPPRQSARPPSARSGEMRTCIDRSRRVSEFVEHQQQQKTQQKIQQKIQQIARINTTLQVVLSLSIPLTRVVRTCASCASCITMYNHAQPCITMHNHV